MGNDQSQASSSGESLQNNVTVTWKKGADCIFPLREGQCACCLGNKMYLFGGVIQGHPEELQESNELLCYDVGKAVVDSLNLLNLMFDLQSAVSIPTVNIITELVKMTVEQILSSR